MENVRRKIYIKLVTSSQQPNCRATKCFSGDLLAIELKQIKVKINKSVYLGLFILEISKILIQEFWYDYTKPKYQQSEKLCYMDTDTFIIHIKTEDVYEDIVDDVEKIFDTSSYEVDKPLPTSENKQ